MSNPNSKQLLRKLWRENYPKDESIRRRRSLRILETIRQSQDFQESRMVGLYVALPWEADLKALWFDRPNHCVFPKVSVTGTQMHFFRIANMSDLKEGYAKILEPDVPEGFRQETWETPSLILVPGLAFDESGARVGSGKGFYDRFLSTIPAGVLKWGICFQEQVQKEKLAQENTDVRMDALITEEGYHAVLR